MDGAAAEVPGLARVRAEVQAVFRREGNDAPHGVVVTGVTAAGDVHAAHDGAERGGEGGWFVLAEVAVEVGGGHGGEDQSDRTDRSDPTDLFGGASVPAGGDEFEGAAGGGLGDAPEVAGVHPADLGIAADGGTIGEGDDGEAVGRDLDGTGEDGLGLQVAGWRGDGWAVEAVSDAVGLRADAPDVPEETAAGGFVEALGLWAGPDADGGGIATRDAGWVGSAGAGGVAEERVVSGAGDGVAGARGASDAGAGIGGGAAEGAWGCDAAADGEVGPHALAGAAELEDLAGGEIDRAPRAERADGTVRCLDFGAGVSARDCDGEVGQGFEDLAAAGEFEGGCGIGVAQKPVGPVEGGGVEGATGGDAEPGEAGAAGILDAEDRPGGLHAEPRDRRSGPAGGFKGGRTGLAGGGEANAVAGREEELLVETGGGRVEEADGGRADQVPPAGTGNGIDAGVFAADGDASCGDDRARGVAARGVKRGIEAGEVSEPGHEAEATDLEFGGGVPLDHLAGAEVVAMGQFREVGSVVSDRDRVLAAGRGLEGFGRGNGTEEFEDAGRVGGAALEPEEDGREAGSDLDQVIGGGIGDAPGQMVDEGGCVGAQRVVQLDEHGSRAVRDEIETGHACGLGSIRRGHRSHSTLSAENRG